jgi:hypothetical protein
LSNGWNLGSGILRRISLNGIRIQNAYYLVLDERGRMEEAAAGEDRSDCTAKHDDNDPGGDSEPLVQFISRLMMLKVFSR